MKVLKDIGAASSGFGIWTGSATKSMEGIKRVDFGVEQFLEFTLAHGLGGIELPPLRFYKNPVIEIPALIKQAGKKNAFLIFDCDQAVFEAQVQALALYVAQTKSKVLRIKTSDILGCERFKIGKNWSDHVQELITRLKKLEPVLNEYDIRIAIENHQDLDSDDLVFILDLLNSDRYGINWDIGNSFATLEEPLEFAKRFENKILNAHIKDYVVLKSEKGFGLLRCELGKGSVNFKEVFSFLSNKAPLCHFAIELGAHHIRWINYKEDIFFKFFKRCDLKNCQRFIDNILEKSGHGKEGSNILTKLIEKEVSLEEAIQLEQEEFINSINYISEIIK